MPTYEHIYRLVVTRLNKVEWRTMDANSPVLRYRPQTKTGRKAERRVYKYLVWGPLQLQHTHTTCIMASDALFELGNRQANSG